jgi:hypothetical protein
MNRIRRYYRQRPGLWSLYGSLHNCDRPLLGDKGCDRRYKAISASRDGFNEARIVRILVNCGAQFLKNYIQASVEVDECAIRPQPLPQFVTADDLPGVFQEQDENAKGLILNFDASAISRQSALGYVRLK